MEPGSHPPAEQLLLVEGGPARNGGIEGGVVEVQGGQAGQGPDDILCVQTVQSWE